MLLRTEKSLSVSLYIIFNTYIPMVFKRVHKIAKSVYQLSSCLYVSMSVHMEQQLGSQWKDFHEIWY